jgi:pilus assembly protein Flp/PilA
MSRVTWVSALIGTNPDQPDERRLNSVISTQSGDSSMSLISRFLRDEAGATAIEYGLIAAGISVAIIATVATLGSKLNDTFTTISGKLG